MKNQKSSRFENPFEKKLPLNKILCLPGSLHTIKHMLNKKNGDKIEFTIVRFHCIYDTTESNQEGSILSYSYQNILSFGTIVQSATLIQLPSQSTAGLSHLA